MDYIQFNHKDKVNSTSLSLPYHFDTACALYGSVDLAREHRRVTFEDVAAGKMDALIRGNLFVGSVEFMREVFSRVGKDPDVPVNDDRDGKIITLAQAKKLLQEKGKIFMKPVQMKQFDGGVFSVEMNDIHQTRDLSEDTLVLVHEVFKKRILSEWRCYVHHGKMVDAKNYSGDYRIMPNWGKVDEKVEWCRKNDFPVAHTVDVAVFDGDEVEVVEFQDMWAIGNYGIPNDLYTRLLTSRYFEIMRGDW